MAKTSAERQAAYRAKRAGQNSSERRLNTWVSAEAYSAIETLARRYSVTQKAVIELLVCNEDGKLKELKAAVAVAKPVAAKKSRAGLLRNDAKEAVAVVPPPKKVVAKKTVAKKLPPNIDAGVAKQRVEKRPAKLAAPKPAAPVGDQYGFEF